jgi:hypothetical protein
MLESLVIYVTSQTHAAWEKAAIILGLRVRVLNVDEAVATDNTGLTEEDLCVYSPEVFQTITQSSPLKRRRPAPLIRWQT